MDKLFFLPKDESRTKYSELFSKENIDEIEFVPYDHIMDKNVFASVVNKLSTQEEDTLIMIPVILDSFNSYSYDGVEIALRIYFNYVVLHKNNFWIIILGTEDESAFWHHCTYSNFLNCPHVDYVKYNLFHIRSFLQKKLPVRERNWSIDWNLCRERLVKVNVRPPASYKTHHSITNEWCIYRWCKYLGIEEIPVSKDIEDYLYFNYLKSIYPESGIERHNVEIVGNGRILLVDDECNKGWDIFFRELLKSNQEIQFDSIGSNFKNLSAEDIEETTIRKIIDFKPTVVILDLRLNDNDFDVASPHEMIGAKILSRIKCEINKGIQVIAFSASNKVWNYLPLASDGVIVKESPEMSAQEGNTRKCLLDMCDKIVKCISKSNSLIPIYKKIRQIESLLINYDYFQQNTGELLGNMKVAFDLLCNNDFQEIKKYFAYSYLQLYIILERFLQESEVYKIDFSKNEATVFGRYVVARWHKINRQLKICDYAIKSDGKSFCIGIDDGRSDTKQWWLDTEFKMSAVLIMGYGIKDLKNHVWVDVRDVRNKKAGHPEQGYVTEEDYLRLLDFMIFIFDGKNRKYASLDCSLPKIETAIVSANTSIFQAKLKDSEDSNNYPLVFSGNKVKLKLNDEIIVKVLLKKEKINELIFVEKNKDNL